MGPQDSSRMIRLEALTYVRSKDEVLLSKNPGPELQQFLPDWQSVWSASAGGNDWSKSLPLHCHEGVPTLAPLKNVRPGRPRGAYDMTVFRWKVSTEALPSPSLENLSLGVHNDTPSPT
jgi:hypothetical protein